MSEQALRDPFGLVGTLVDGQYRVDKVVGEGGFGVVYKGRALALDQPIAIKVLKGLDGDDPQINEAIHAKFREEARLLYTLSQASLNIVRSLHYGVMTTPSGIWTPFIVLEWLEGRSLEDDLEHRRANGYRGRTLDEAMAILEPAAAGLTAAHERGVVHRDIKPANFFLVLDATRVKVLDFGVAKIMKDGEEAGTKGTFASFTWLYATPEQLDPRYGRTTLATDVYAFALVITELLTDRLTVDACDTVSIMRAATDTNVRPTPRTRGAQVPDAFEHACRRALSVDPASRFPTIKEFWTALTSARVSTTTGAMPARSSIVATGQTTTGAMPARSVTVTAPAQTAGRASRPSQAGPPSPPARGAPTIPPQPVVMPSPGTYPPPPTRATSASGYPWGPPPPAGQGVTTGPFAQQPPLRTAPPSGGATTVIVTVILFVLASVFATWCALSS